MKNEVSILEKVMFCEKNHKFYIIMDYYTYSTKPESNAYI